MKHTPGPWKVTNNEKTDFISVRVGNGHPIDLWDASWESDEDRDEWLANANLIGAAPDLLKAAQELIAGMDEMEHPHRNYAQVENLRSAIEKAIPTPY